MTDIILKEKDGVQTMDSREIAELTEKRHDHVLRDVRKQLEQQNIPEPTFGAGYLDGNNQERKCFHLDYDQTMILVSGYSIPLRAKIIKRWRELEEKALASTKPSYLIEDSIQRAKQWIVEQEEKQQLQIAYKSQEERVERLVHNNTTYTSTQLAKELHFTSGAAFNKDLHEKGIQFKDHKGLWMLYAEYSTKGFTNIKQKEVIHKTTGKTETKYFRQWTGLGRDYIIGLYSSKENK